MASHTNVSGAFNSPGDAHQALACSSTAECRTVQDTTAATCVRVYQNWWANYQLVPCAGGSTPAPPTAAPATTPAVTPAWLSAFNMQWAAARGNLQRMAADVQVASKTWKAPDFSKGLGVKLDVDVLNPAISSVRQQYQALPEPLREVLPFAGAGNE